MMKGEICYISSSLTSTSEKAFSKYGRVSLELNLALTGFNISVLTTGTEEAPTYNHWILV
jgi:hypothetical protein